MADMKEWKRDQKVDNEKYKNAVVIYCKNGGKEYRIIGDRFEDKDGNKSENIILLEELDDTNSKLKECLKKFGVSAVLFEWDEYDFEIGKENDEAEVLVGDKKLTKRRGRYQLQFQNQLGKAVIRIKTGEKEIKLPEIEVISRKLHLEEQKSEQEEEDPFFYPTFYTNIVNELKEHCLSLSFDILAPTYLRAEEALRPPSPLFIFHYFKRNWKEIMEAYNTIVYQPYKRLVERDNFVRISQVKAIDGSVIHDIITHPERWEEVKTQSSFPLAKKLGNRLPTMVLQREKYETYDVPENRFAKFFLQMLLNELGNIMTVYKNQLDKSEFKEVKENLGTLRDFLMSIQTMDVFVEAGEMRIFPANSTVLQKKDGYRELLKLYREFLLSYCPLFKKIEEALAARDIATLYEYWCFFEIGKVLGEVFSENKKEPKLVWDATGGLEKGGEISFKFRNEDYKLVYNKSFSGRSGSYSVTLIPDYSLERQINGKNKKKEIVEIVFDAKFRFEEFTENEIEREINEEREVRAENTKLVAKFADICKMHTYKDALKLKAAFIVFPGDTACLFKTNGERYKTGKKNEGDKDIGELTPDFEGIGYIPLVPKKEEEIKGEEIFEKILKNLLGKEV
jgi:hypothetical protein